MTLYDDPGRNRNRRYIIMLVGCELLNCVSVFVVWNMTDVFLGGRFNAYGRYLLTYLKHGEKKKPHCTWRNKEQIGHFNKALNKFTILKYL